MSNSLTQLNNDRQLVLNRLQSGRIRFLEKIQGSSEETSNSSVYGAQAVDSASALLSQLGHFAKTHPGLLMLGTGLLVTVGPRKLIKGLLKNGMIVASSVLANRELTALLIQWVPHLLHTLQGMLKPEKSATE